MAEYEILFKESVYKDFKRIPKSDLRKILSKIENLSKNPRLKGCEKLTDQERYRVRQVKYRIVYSIQDDNLSVCIVKVGHRKNIYR
jgi:mRNA interferase RelE/StbE